MSTVAAYKAALVTFLTANLTDVQVIYGPRTGATITKTQILEVGGIIGTTSPGSFGAGRPVDEKYAIELTASCSLTGADSQQTVTEQALGLREDVEDLLRSQTSSSLGVAGITLAEIGEDFELTEPSITNGSNAAVRFHVHVEANT